MRTLGGAAYASLSRSQHHLSIVYGKHYGFPSLAISNMKEPIRIVGTAKLRHELEDVAFKIAPD